KLISGSTNTLILLCSSSQLKVSQSFGSERWLPYCWILKVEKYVVTFITSQSKRFQFGPPVPPCRPTDQDTVIILPNHVDSSRMTPVRRSINFCNISSLA